MRQRFEGDRPVGAAALVVWTQHASAISNGAGHRTLRDYVMSVFEEVFPPGWLPGDQSQTSVNPAGPFEIGGLDGDAGLAGRKIIVDT